MDECVFCGREGDPLPVCVDDPTQYICKRHQLHYRGELLCPVHHAEKVKGDSEDVRQYMEDCVSNPPPMHNVPEIRAALAILWEHLEVLSSAVEALEDEQERIKKIGGIL